MVWSAVSEGASRVFSKSHYEEWVNIFISLIFSSICLIPSLKLNSATVLETGFGMWFCCTNSPFCSAASVIRLLQRLFCALDSWIDWKASGSCSRRTSILSQFRSQSSCQRAKPGEAIVLPGSAAWCQGPQLPRIPLSLSHTRETPLYLRNPGGIHSSPPQS